MLDEAIAHYREHGYAVLRNVIDSDLIGEALKHVEWLGRKYPELRPEEYHHPLIRNDAFWTRLVSDPRLVDIAAAVLGSDIACFTAHYISKPPIDGQAVLWHQDGGYWKLDPMEALTVWLAIDASTTENGCLRIIPGSHVEEIHPPKLRVDVPNMLSSEANADLVEQWLDRNGIVDIELNPGDVSIHHPNILHYSEANTSDTRRCGLDIGYVSTSTKVTNEGVYLDALLVKGSPVPGVNRYRPFPAYDESETISFLGSEHWNDKIVALNATTQAASDAGYVESPLEGALRMIDRLREGSVAR